MKALNSDKVFDSFSLAGRWFHAIAARNLKEFNVFVVYALGTITVEPCLSL